MKQKTTYRKNQKNNTATQTKKEVENEEISLLVVAKRLGLSFEELNMMTLQDLVDFVDIWTDKGDNQTTDREASQLDIDAFYSKM